MAIFRASTNHISRGKGHNVVAAAAYRSGEKLTDTNILNPDATTHDYTKKRGVLATAIILPKLLSEQGFTIDRQTLWSSVEQHETTTRSVKGSRLKNTARLAREWLVSLPHELSNDVNEQLTAEFTQRLADDLGVIGDYCIHVPTVDNYKPQADYSETYDPDTNTREKLQINKIKASQPDERNIHAHIMFTTRKATMTADGNLLLGDKADSEISEKHRQDRGMVNGGDYIKEIRSLWAEMVNERLAQYNIAPVTAQSYKDQGLNIKPQHKQGKNASVLARYSFKPPIVGFNDDIKHDNRAVIKSAANQCIASIGETTEKANNWIDQASKWLSKATPAPFDSKQSAEEFDEQTVIFDRLAKRADRVLDKPPRALIDQAVEKYIDILFYEPIIQRSDWSGGGSEANPEPNPNLDFNDRQLDIIKNISQHLEGLDSNHISPSELRESLTQQSNRHILILLTDPTKEQSEHEIDTERSKQAIVDDKLSTLDITQNIQSAARAEQPNQNPPIPRNTYRPR